MAEPPRLLIDRTATPIGELIVVADTGGHLRAVDWTGHEARMHRLLRLHYGTDCPLHPARDPAGLTTAMNAYFAGDVAIIDGLPVRTAGTAFQRLVWDSLRAVPCGTTLSYAELARRIGRPSAVRAVSRPLEQPTRPTSRPKTAALSRPIRMLLSVEAAITWCQ